VVKSTPGLLRELTNNVFPRALHLLYFPTFAPSFLSWRNLPAKRWAKAPEKGGFKQAKTDNIQF
jgi:hypothetical protein